MAKATRDLKVILELSEDEAQDLYIHLRPNYHPNYGDEIKKQIKNALGYEPLEPPDL
jgi:hypothetical protein